MQNEMSLRSEVSAGLPVDDQHGIADRFGPYKKLHRVLRGRYLMLAVLATFGAAVGAVVGYNISKVTYRSEGLIQVAYTLPAVMQKTDQNEPMQMYEEYLESQVLMIESKEVLGLALKYPEWKLVANGAPIPGEEEFANQLTVEHPPRTQAIRISCVARDAEMAAAGVHSVIAAYMSIAKEGDKHEDAQRLQTLRDRKEALGKQIDTMIASVAGKSEPLTANQIAMFDDLMRDYVKQLNVLQANLEVVKSRGALTSNPMLVGMQAEVDRLKAHITKYATDFESMQQAMATSPQTTASHVALVPQYESFHTTLAQLRSELEETNRRIETLQIEGTSVDRRMTVISPGDVPASSYKDRRVLMAGMGLLGGALVPSFLIACLGLMSGRLRYSDEALHEPEQPQLLGILPMLPKRMSNPVMAGVGAHCVHHLRMRLQLMGQENKRVFMITSSASREGKTSLTMALGLSFAAAGSRTLIIDGDTIGRTLTYRLCAAHEPGLISAITDPSTANLKPVEENLWLLPVGHRRELATAELAPGMLDPLIASLREKFDYILIDTGPILGSLEASAIAQSADSVILAISQGQHASLVRQSFQTLRTINAKVGGYVFNRAAASDYGRNMDQSSSRYSTPRQVDIQKRLGSAKARPEYAFSPLAQSVIYFRPKSSQNGGH